MTRDVTVIHSPTHPEIAAFLRLALDAKLATIDEVVRWADSIVLSEPRPPAWSLDLALCRSWPLQWISDTLAEVAAGTVGDVVRQLLAGRLAGSAARGEVEMLHAIRLAWSLPLVKHDDEPFDALSKAVFATSECLDGVTEGWMTQDAAAAIFREAFGPLARWEWSAA